MVRVFRFQQFGKQDVFSSEGEPVALACSEEWLFIATAKRVVEVLVLFIHQLTGILTSLFYVVFLNALFPPWFFLKFAMFLPACAAVFCLVMAS